MIPRPEAPTSDCDFRATSALWPSCYWHRDGRRVICERFEQCAHSPVDCDADGTRRPIATRHQAGHTGARGPCAGPTWRNTNHKKTRSPVCVTKIQSEHGHTSSTPTGAYRKNRSVLRENPSQRRGIISKPIQNTRRGTTTCYRHIADSRRVRLAC